MALDPKYILASDLMGVFVDKDTALPLAGGVITFYRDAARNTLKYVYQMSGTAADPVYTVLPNPITLGINGAYQDALGNSIVPYWYPYTAGGDVDNYYVTVESAGGVMQFTRNAWPNFTGNDTAESDEINFIPNGQFLTHNSNAVKATSGGLDITPVAQGGWQMQVSTGLGGVYSTTFTRLQSGAAWLNDFPRYFANFKCTSSGNEAVHDLAIQWNDVNEFSGANQHADLGTQGYTLFLAALSNAGSVDVDIVRIKYFGAGGNATENLVIGTISVTSSGGYFNVPLTFGSNLGKTVGAANDDFVQLAFRPKNPTFDLLITDVGLFLGTLALSSFPTMTPAQMLSQSVTGWMPVPAADGSDLYLPLVLTQRGVTFDNSEIGSLVTTLSTTPSGNLLKMDGAPYLFSNYSSLGIPYSRLGAFLTGIINYYIATPGNQIYGNAVYPSGINIPLFGSGVTFVNAYGVVGQPTQFLLYINVGAGVATIPAIGTAPLTLTVSADPSFTFTVNSVPTAAQYFTFTAPVAAPVSYYVWFRVDNAGTNPAPGGTGIVCDIASTDTTAQVAIKIMSAINQYMFATYNIAGFFLRQFDSAGLRDTGYNARLLCGILGSGDFVGTSELAAFLDHVHNPIGGGGITSFIGNQAAGINTVTGAPAAIGSSATTGFSPTVGVGTETRPVNFAVNYFIRY